ncbi:MAG TPA: type II restriction endonuclease [Candidatus Bacteroides merdigallinarum]|uniref:Type-2 restriction enzyme n=1 Tax=Candidatus Bacteroides merdigallinarum TaxID=2838473 RepID=A0A9D2E9M4_9BACE|nr:type II restriction endonuclease [Candidatus Bacteroides merdigallinarum]
MNKVHTEEQFRIFMSQLIETNATLDFFSDFDKIAANVDAISMKLNQLNYLIGKEDMEKAVFALWDENPKVFSVLDILIAVRTSDKKKAIARNGQIQLIENFFKTPAGVVEYLEDTGLKQIFQDKRVTNLVDYVFGVETGLDTNARKNRSGDIMGNRVADLFQENGVEFRREVYSTEFEEMKCLGEDRKRFDFVIEATNKTYLIEVNFYSGGGSKLNEVARAYSELAPKINQFDNYEFVWITDGVGWKSARNKLEEAYYAIPSVYNLATIKDFIQSIK